MSTTKEGVTDHAEGMDRQDQDRGVPLIQGVQHLLQDIWLCQVGPGREGTLVVT